MPACSRFGDHSGVAAGRSKTHARIGAGALVCALAVCLNGTRVATQSSDRSTQPVDSPVRPSYALLRDEEDWSFLEDHPRTDTWDLVKFIPLRWLDASYLSLGGEVRQQYERFANEEWGAETDDRSGYVLQRYMLHGDIRLRQRFRIFVQVKSGIETGRAGGPRPPDENRFDWHQAYAAVDVGARSRTHPVSLRAGRQEFQFGSGRLISVREGPNVRQSFDALRLLVRAGTWRVDAFVSRPVSTSAGTFDDRGDPTRALWGAYAVRGAPGAGLGVDVYYLGYEREQARFDQGRGRERRRTVGARVWGRAGSIDFNTEVAGQWGTLGASRIRAWTLASDTGYRLRLRGSPRVGIRADITSGDRDRTDGILGTFNPLFPKGAYFGLIAPSGPLNHLDLHPSIEFTPKRNWTVSAGWLFLWRAQRDDGLYGVPGNLLRSGQGTRAGSVGQSPGTEIVWELTRHFSVTADVAIFSAGSFLNESPPAKTITYLGLWATYKF